MDIGSAVGRNEGVTDRQLLELADFEHSNAFSDLEKAVLRYATHLTQTPAEVPEDVFDALRPHLTPPQLVELTSAIAWENYRARFNRGFDVEAQGFTEGAACAVPVRVGAAAT
jgi:4-carboxymuconolactone decarboxylase